MIISYATRHVLITLVGRAPTTPSPSSHLLARIGYAANKGNPRNPTSPEPEEIPINPFSWLLRMARRAILETGT